MAITLSNAGDVLTLSDRLHWADEFSWSPVEQRAEWSITGALLVQVATKLAGRPITLEGADTQAWIARSACATLATWAAQPGLELQLMLRGALRTVVFDHERGGFEAAPIWVLLDGEAHAEQLFLPTLRFLTV